MRPKLRALTILVGDWNFTREGTDRIDLATAEWSKNANDSKEHDDWRKSVFDLCGLHEAWQGELMHRSSQGAAQFDRAYVNPHIAEQQYSCWAMVVLPWCAELSTHRPIEIARRGPGHEDERKKTSRSHQLGAKIGHCRLLSVGTASGARTPCRTPRTGDFCC